MRVAGLSVEEVDRLSDEFEALVVREMARAARAAAQHLGDAMEGRRSKVNVSQADVNVIFRLWEIAARERLLPALEAVWLAGANHQQRELSKAVAALTAAVALPGPDSEPGEVMPDPEPVIPSRFVSGAEAALSFLGSAFNRLVGIGNELWAAARVSLTEGMFHGESIPKLAARVRDSVGVAEPRATVIARTEVIGAANAGSITSMRSTRGLVTNKVWLATHDSRVRPTHIAAHDQSVPLNGRFTVGMAQLDHPGDPFGPPEEIINCRCSMDYEVNMDRAALTAADVGPTTGMIALRPADPEEFAVEGGDSPEELHVTMTFLGEVDEELHESARKAAQRAAEQAGPFTARVSGFGVLGDEDAVVLFLNGGGFDSIHRALAEEDLAAPEQFAPWICHMTLGYGIDIETGRQFIGREFTIDALSVDVGDNHDRFALGSGAAILPAAATGEAGVGRVFQLEQGQTARWRGVMVVEDTPTGDGRQFAADALTWPDMPLPLQWQKETSHGGINDVTVTVGTIESIERDGNTIIGEGMIDLGSEDGREVYRRILPPEQGGLGLGGVSIVADDPEQADVEYVYPDGCNLDDLSPEEIDDMPLEEINRCLNPILVIFHSGRIRALTVVDTPAFVEAKIEIVDEAEVTAAVAEPVVLSVGGKTYEIGQISSPEDLQQLLAAAAQEVSLTLLASEVFTPVRSHETGTTDATWSKSDNEGRLDSPMSVSTAENMYAWIDRDRIEDGEIVKDACSFPHHMVGEDGDPGAANLAACRAAIGALNGARGGTSIPSGDREGVYNHVAKHIRDAGEEPPELRSADELVELQVDGRTFLIDPELQEPSEELVAAAYTVTIPDLPPLDWFAEPSELPPIGAIRITPEGRIYGLVAPKGVAHRGISDRRQEVPMGNVDYSRFMSRATPVVLADGTVEEIPTGPITMNCGHAKTHPSVTSDQALEHYDNSCSVVASVRVGENRHGVWVAGAMVHGVSAEDLARLLMLQLSGDWRPHPEKPGMREFTAALAVPVPGFVSAGPTMRIENGQLVAATAPIALTTDDTSVPTFGTETVVEETTVTEVEIDLPEAVEQQIVEHLSSDDDDVSSTTKQILTEQEADAQADATDAGPDEFGGKPSKGTKKDRRLKENEAADLDVTATHDGYVEDLPDFETALRENDPKWQVARLREEVGLDIASQARELVASVMGDSSGV